MQPRPLTVGLALTTLVVLTGCSAFGVGGQSAADRAVTPAPVPTAEPSLPPGVSAGGVTSHRKLGVAHEQRLANRSYTVRVVRTVRFDNGTTVRRLERGRAVGTDGRALSWVSDPRTGQVERPAAVIVSRRAWTNATVRVLRYEYANGTARYTVTRPRQRSPYRETGHTIGRVLAEEDATVVASDTSATPRTYILSARSLPADMATNAALDTVETSGIRAVITEGGLVRHATIRYAGTRAGAPAVANSTVTYDTDTGRVTRPDWVGAALDRRADQTARENETAQETQTARTTEG